MNPPSRPLDGCLVVVPAFNEAESLPAVLEDLLRELPGAEILVVDDGSTDGTARAVPDAVRVLRLPFNLGIGGAMQAGYRYALWTGARVVVQVDGDGQHRGDQVRKLLGPISSGVADLVVGSRFLEAGEYEQTATRGIGAAALHGLIRILAGQWVTDCTSGFRAANRSVVKTFAEWYPDDYPEPEVLAMALRSRFRVREVPVRMNPRLAGKSSISPLDAIVYMVKVSTAMLLDMLRDPWAGAQAGDSAPGLGRPPLPRQRRARAGHEVASRAEVGS
ncbi:MAG: glycosyltransferase family 2 protein [Gemmatimonadota bacterium]